MSDRILLVDPNVNRVQPIESISFGDLKVKERQGLQEWVIQNPDVLGEDLLVITSEFAGFDKSRRRLDILALDRDGNLVVVELKLDASSSLADLQAIRYAAFCSTMQPDDVVQELAAHESVSEEEAHARIMEFLETDELPSLEGEPRIILAAGSMDDQELTSCVLWLRPFGIDISCVELTPYKMPEADRIMLVPRVVIPLPEARDYVVSVERKEARKRRDARPSPAQALWRAITREFNAFHLPFQARPARSHSHCQVRVGASGVHYEWKLRKRANVLEVALHFEHGSREENLRLLDLVRAAEDEIRGDVARDFEVRDWGNDKWTLAHFLLPYGDEPVPDQIAGEAAYLMKVLIERTWPLIREHIGAKDASVSFPAGE